MQKDIKKESSSEDIQAAVKEAKKVVVLKVVSGVTEYEDASENISEDVASNWIEKWQAKSALRDSLQTADGDYSIIVRSAKSLPSVLRLFHKFDTSVEVSQLYSLGNKKYYEVTIGAQSIFRQEMLEDIESGILPESFLGVEIVLPEVFGVSDVSGEQLGDTWGIREYATYDYLSDFEQKSASIKVAVVDTGIDYQHPDLKDRVIHGYDFVNDDADAMDDQ